MDDVFDTAIANAVLHEEKKRRVKEINVLCKRDGNIRTVKTCADIYSDEKCTRKIKDIEIEEGSSSSFYVRIEKSTSQLDDVSIHVELNDKEYLETNIPDFETGIPIHVYTTKGLNSKHEAKELFMRGTHFDVQNTRKYNMLVSQRSELEDGLKKIFSKLANKRPRVDNFLRRFIGYSPINFIKGIYHEIRSLKENEMFTETDRIPTSLFFDPAQPIYDDYSNLQLGINIYNQKHNQPLHTNDFFGYKADHRDEQEEIIARILKLRRLMHKKLMLEEDVINAVLNDVQINMEFKNKDGLKTAYNVMKKHYKDNYSNTVLKKLKEMEEDINSKVSDKLITLGNERQDIDKEIQDILDENNVNNEKEIEKKLNLIKTREEEFIRFKNDLDVKLDRESKDLESAFINKSGIKDYNYFKNTYNDNGLLAENIFIQYKKAQKELECASEEIRKQGLIMSVDKELKILYELYDKYEGVTNALGHLWVDIEKKLNVIIGYTFKISVKNVSLDTHYGYLVIKYKKDEEKEKEDDDNENIFPETGSLKFPVRILSKAIQNHKFYDSKDTFKFISWVEHFPTLPRVEPAFSRDVFEVDNSTGVFTHTIKKSANNYYKHKPYGVDSFDPFYLSLQFRLFLGPYDPIPPADVFERDLSQRNKLSTTVKSTVYITFQRAQNLKSMISSGVITNPVELSEKKLLLTRMLNYNSRIRKRIDLGPEELTYRERCEKMDLVWDDNTFRMCCIINPKFPKFFNNFTTLDDYTRFLYNNKSEIARSLVQVPVFPHEYILAFSTFHKFGPLPHKWYYLAVDLIRKYRYKPNEEVSKLFNQLQVSGDIETNSKEGIKLISRIKSI